MEIDYYFVSAARRAHRLRSERFYRIGRETGADIHLQDAMISRKHAELHWAQGQGWVLRDLGSRNGSMINGKRVNGDQLLGDQDRVQFGGNVFQYYMVPPGSDLGALSDQAPKIDEDVTMGPGVNASDIMTQGAAFTGKVGDGGVLDLLQFLMMTRKTGRLDLMIGSVPLGAIHVEMGGVLDAQFAMGHGFDALLKLSKAGATMFAFHNDAEKPESVTITMNADGILMELARNLDEG